MTDRTFNKNIHGLRGIAALSIFIFHIYQMSHAVGILPDTYQLPPLIPAILSYGVELFFMISGYLIVGSLLRHGNIKAFLVDRAIRIYPVFIFIHILLFSIAPLIHYKFLANTTLSIWLFHFFSNLFMLPGIFDLPAVQVVAWSLSYECAFYLVAALIYGLWRYSPILAYAFMAVLLPIIFISYPRCIFFGIGSALFFLERHNMRLLTLRLFHLILQKKEIQFLGTISYSFYLWHTVVTYPLKYLILRGMGIYHVNVLYGCFTLGAAGFMLSILVAYASHQLLEIKVSRILKEFSYRK